MEDGASSLLILSHNRTPASQLAIKQRSLSPITGIRQITLYRMYALLSSLCLPYLIFWENNPTSYHPHWGYNLIDKIWGQGSCHSSVHVWTTVLPRKVHTHDWGCMGLILLHSPLCLWSIWARKGGCWLKGKQGCMEKGKSITLECFWCRTWIFWHLIPFHCYYLFKTTTTSEKIRFEIASGVYLWNERHSFK